MTASACVNWTSAVQLAINVKRTAGAGSDQTGRVENEAPDDHPSHRESAPVQVSACVQIAGDLGCMDCLAEECIRFADDGR